MGWDPSMWLTFICPKHPTKLSIPFGNGGLESAACYLWTFGGGKLPKPSQLARRFRVLPKYKLSVSPGGAGQVTAREKGLSFQ